MDFITGGFCSKVNLTYDENSKFLVGEDNINTTCTFIESNYTNKCEKLNDDLVGNMNRKILFNQLKLMYRKTICSFFITMDIKKKRKRCRF